MSPLLCAMNILHMKLPPKGALGGVLPKTETTQKQKRGNADVEAATKIMSQPKLNKSDSDLNLLPDDEELSLRFQQQNLHSSTTEVIEKATIFSENSLHLHSELNPWIWCNGASLEEENTLLVNGKPMGAEARKKYFLKTENRQDFVFYPQYIYNFGKFSFLIYIYIYIYMCVYSNLYRFL